MEITDSRDRDEDTSTIAGECTSSDTVNRMMQFGVLAAFSVSALSLIDAVVPADASSGYEELVIVSILFILGVAAKSWPKQRAVKKQRACCESDDSEVHSEVVAECRCNDVGDWSIAADPLPTTTGSCTHDDMDVERVTPSELQPENDVQDPVRHGAVAQKVVNAVAKLGDPSRVEYFFKRMEVCDLEPSQMMRDTLMSICLRKSDAIRAENFLMRVLMVSEDCERSGHILSAESRKRLTISFVLFILMFIYRGLA